MELVDRGRAVASPALAPDLVCPCRGGQRAPPAERCDRDRHPPQAPRQVDDAFAFIIRDVAAKTEVKGTFSAKPYDPYFAFFTSGERATVSGVRRGNRFYATAIGPGDGAVEMGGGGA